ncbi:hypothetical protein AVEN_100825-1 [Araneus ventricosus]|uniref:Uncharacterized protein n=1 Tax=Araneus ventricosus TaxID=182803 RepID=A0A4Y2AV62_ARAVE|nr:hypothetical protein AVEN_100825-1 [Araneus ventricosus]
MTMDIKVFYAEAPIFELSESSCEDPSFQELLISFLSDYLDLNYVLLTQKAEKSDSFDEAVECLIQMKYEQPEMYDTVLKFLGTHQHPDDFTTVMKKLIKKFKSEESLAPRPYFTSKLLVPFVKIDYRLSDGTESTTALHLPSICE